MPRSNKAIGSSIERKYRRKLERRFGFRVTRAAGSFGMYDLIAWRVSSDGRGILRFIQVKKGRISAKEKRGIADDPLPETIEIRKEVYIWDEKERTVLGRKSFTGNRRVEDKRGKGDLSKKD